MDILNVITVLIILCAFFSYLNERFIKLPGTIGVVTISMILSIVVLAVGRTNSGLTNPIIFLAHSIDFSKVLLDVMLGFLLFASALHFDYQKLKEQRLPVLLLSTLGVVISAGVFGGLFWLATQFLHMNTPLMYCFLFGALISPTDPIAVGAILKKSKIPTNIQTIISGESLFNDGVGLVMFVILLNIVDQSQTNLSWAEIVRLFAHEVLGGIGIGLIMGYFGYRLIKSIKNFQTILLISIALVLGVADIASQAQASIPLASVTAGLIVGNESFDKKNNTREFLNRIWQLVDEVLNTLLFVMIGLQLVIMPFLSTYRVIGCLSIVIILTARLISIALPTFFLLHKVNFGNLSILTWAGLRGGISIAMALSLPNSPYREIILSSCYFIVIFSIIVQGLTLNKLVEKITQEKTAN